MDTIRRDLGLALRLLGKNPGFAAAAVLTLALGIAANAAIFGFMNALLFQPFPLLDTSRLMAVVEIHPEQGAPGGPGESGGGQNPLAVADYLDLRANGVGLESVAAYRYHDFVVTEAGEPERVAGFQVTPGYFETLGHKLALGRGFLAAEGQAGSNGCVVVSDGFWRRHLGADASVLGRTFVLDGRRHEIVGVLPAGLNFPPGKPDVFAPLAFSEAENSEREKLNLAVVARLPEGGSRASAQASLDAFAARLAHDHAVTNAGRKFFLLPLRETQAGLTMPFLLLFEGAAGFLLLIACANVAGLLIARGAGREREMALRAALGAGRVRIVGQLVTEGLVLAFLAAALALWLAHLGVDVIRGSLPPDLVRWVAGWSEIRVDDRTLLFTLGLTLATTLGFALLPALQASRIDLAEVLKAGGRGSASRPRSRLRGALVAVQTSLALVLLAGAVLMTRGFFDLLQIYQGFDPERVVSLGLNLPAWRYPDDRAIAGFHARVLQGLEATPGVEAAAVVSQLPADLGPIPRTSFAIEGRPVERPLEKPSADLQAISPGYLQALRVPIQHGRGFTDADGAELPAVALVSESLAARYWPGEDALGRRIRLRDDEPWRTVVGVVGDVRQYWFNKDPRPTLYVPDLQSPGRGAFLVVRSRLPTAALVKAARARIREVDGAQPVDEVRTLGVVVAESASFIRMAAALMVTLAAVALLLCVVGLHGVVAEHVARSTHEIGVRMALGARGRDVAGLVVGRAGRLVALGLVAGLLAALAVGRLVESALFGIVRPDVLTLVGLAGVLALVALGAAWTPARRATRVDPLAALRHE